MLKVKRVVKVRDTEIGSGKVKIQSMTNVRTSNVPAVLGQIAALSAAGCDIVRVSVPDPAAAQAMKEIVPASPLPVVADIHFDYRLAISAVENGAHKIRINPGNIGSFDRVKAVADCCRAHGVPIRVGVNGGSLPKELLAAYGDTPQALAECALQNVRLLERAGFSEIVVSVKSTSVRATVEANRILADCLDYPLHIGVTEAGTEETGLIKSAIGLGSLLLDGIGDTIRVSLTGDPVREVDAARQILRALRLETDFVEVISCPTCARTECDVEGLARSIRSLTEQIRVPLQVAVMGCVVNGVGEGKRADLGIAGGKGKSAIFRRGEVVCTVENERLLETFRRFLDEELAAKDKGGTAVREKRGEP